MRYILLLSFILFGQLCLAQNEWAWYQSYEGKFKILVPGEIQTNEKVIPTEIGELTYHTYYHQDKSELPENFLYILSYVDYPEGGIHSDSTDLIEEFFKVTAEEASLQLAGNLQYENRADWKDYPAYIWRIDYNEEQAIMKSKAIIVDNRFYLLQVAMTKDRSINAAANKYLDSFDLLE